MSDIIIRPELIWIEGRCYRVNDPTTDVTSFQEHELYGNDNDIVLGEEEDDCMDEEFEVIQINERKYSTTLHVPQYYLGSIIGRMGATKKRIERDTWTEIKIPKQGQSGDVVISGPGASNVKAARRKINMIVLSSRMKQRPTHFISIPVNFPDIVENFMKFKEAALRSCGACAGVEESLFVSAARLHVTLAVVTLMDDRERARAAQLLHQARDNIIMPLVRARGRLRARVRGVRCMSDEHSNAHVLYAQVQDAGEDAAGGDAGTLQELADRVRDHFYRAGFVDRERNPAAVKLHVTLLNSRHRASGGAGAGGAGARRQGFDATRLLSEFGEHEFGSVEVGAVHLSNMHDADESSYYTSSCEVSCYDD